MCDSEFWHDWKAWIDKNVKPRRRRRVAKLHRNLDELRALAECYGIKLLVPDGLHHVQFRYLDYIGNYYPSTRKFFMQSPVLLPTETGVPPEEALRLFLTFALKLEARPETLYESFWIFHEDRTVPTDVQHVGEYLMPRVREEILRIGAFRPEAMDIVEAHEFEQLIATLLREEGFDCTVTQASRDGGKDIVAIRSGSGQEYILLVECKKWLAQNVGLDVVQRAVGVKYIEKADHSMIVTTAHFTQPASEVASRVVGELTLVDRNTLADWLYRFHVRRGVEEATHNPAVNTDAAR